jgi:hypothetical protein
MQAAKFKFFCRGRISVLIFCPHLFASLLGWPAVPVLPGERAGAVDGFARMSPGRRSKAALARCSLDAFFA